MQAQEGECRSGDDLQRVVNLETALKRGVEGRRGFWVRGQHV